MAEQTNNSESISETAASSTAAVTTTPNGVQSNISVTAPVIEYFKKFTSLNPTAEPLPQGDGTIRISPFDDYIIFTIFDETGEDGEMRDTPIDLSNVGTLTLVFVGENDEIRIPNWTQVLEVDLAQGQVLFRIDNQNFYVSTRMEDENGVSDESVLYTGTFLTIQDEAKQTMTAKINEQALLYAQELAALQAKNVSLNNQLSEMLSLDEEQIALIEDLQTNNLELVNEVAALTEELGSTESELVLKTAQLVQKRNEELKRKRQQIAAITMRGHMAQTGAVKQRFFKQAAYLLETYNTSGGPVDQ